MSRPARHLTARQGHAVQVLRNWLLGFLAIAIWTTNYLVYFAGDIRAWRRRARQQPMAGWPHEAMPDRSFAGPLPPHERRLFPPPEPPPEPPPVHDAEIIPFPRTRRASGEHDAHRRR